ncbi:transposable element Tcb1 transposase [Trichonephila clavipes]|uniref:Transposable element Tcb1 transposase n=1 Tax=Trichonephila clavipes TaxID=2585209 RepID=A0A8X7BKY8_TRICX|nr:transposable element Tcb1 transposase [Trichonephila clavipes]
MEAGWSTRREARQVGRSDLTVRCCWGKWREDTSFNVQTPVALSLRAPVTSRTIGSYLAEGYLVSRHPLPGVMVWSAIAYDARSPPLLIHCTLAAYWYVPDILHPHVLLLMARLQGAIFQQGNARPHGGRMSQDRLRYITTLPWPA